MDILNTEQIDTTVAQLDTELRKRDRANPQLGFDVLVNALAHNLNVFMNHVEDLGDATGVLGEARAVKLAFLCSVVGTANIPLHGDDD